MWRLSCLVALILLAPCAEAGAQAGRIDGTVTNRETGKAVSGARVIVEGTSWFARTDRDGRYTITEVPAGVYDVRIEAAGFEPRVHVNYRVTAPPTTLDVALRPLQTGIGRGTAATAPATPVRPGFGFGASLGMTGLRGDAYLAVRNALGADLSLRYGTASGLFLYAGAQYASHAIDSVSSPLGRWALYVEPRFVLLHASPALAPYVGARFAYSREQADDPRSSFTASGYSFGGETGVFVRLSRELAIEGGVGAGVQRVGDYVFQGDVNAYTCVDALDPGTALPESVARCGGQPAGAALITCYPPFYDVSQTSSECDPPKIPRDGSGRSGWWYQVRLGLQISLGVL